MSVGVDELGNSANNFYMSPQIDRLTLSFYAENDWWTGNPNGPRIFIYEYYPSNGTYSAQAVGVLEFSKEIGKRVKATIPFKSKLTDKYEGYICSRGYFDGVYKNCHDFMISFGDANETYSDYVSAESALILPSEHPYLAKIGDVADEIKVDRDGNVSLIANVGKYTVDTVPYAQDEVNNFGILLGMHGASDRYLCAYLSDRHTLYGHSVDWLTLYKSDVTFTTVDEAKQFLKGKVFFYQAKEPKTYPLGKITLPALPESVSNVLTDAEVTPKTTIEYTKDVNIVIANIESAIASIS